MFCFFLYHHVHCLSQASVYTALVNFYLMKAEDRGYLHDGEV